MICPIRTSSEANPTHYFIKSFRPDMCWSKQTPGEAGHQLKLLCEGSACYVATC